jgi:nucleotide-binding universal stress UspA family protein
MQAISHIVAATDFSPAAERAIYRAALIAKQLNANLSLIHVAHPLDLYVGTELSFGSQKQIAHMQQSTNISQLSVIADNLKKDFDIPIEIATRIGLAHAEIASYAASKAGCLIVAGARGQHENAILNLLLGSTATRLLRSANCPVLIVKNKKVSPYQQVIAAVDFSEGSRAVPTIACTLAPEATVETLHVFDVTQEARMRQIGLDDEKLHLYQNSALMEVGKQLDKILAKLSDNRVTSKVVTGYPASGICVRATELPADLIVIGRHGMSGFQEWPLGSVSKDVSQVATCDVIVVTNTKLA